MAEGGEGRRLQTLLLLALQLADGGLALVVEGLLGEEGVVEVARRVARGHGVRGGELGLGGAEGVGALGPRRDQVLQVDQGRAVAQEALGRLPLARCLRE